MMVPPFDDDELVSAYLDGEATPDEVARVESDPVLLARVESLRTTIGLVAQPVGPAPPEAREAAIAAALAVADEVLPRSQALPPAPAPPIAQLSAPPPPAPAPAPVIDLAARRRRTNRTWLAAAAAVAVAVLAIPLVLRSQDDDKRTAANRADTTAQDEPGPTGDPGDTTTGGAAAEALQGDLGEFATWNQLHRAISKELDRGADLSDDYDTPCEPPDDFVAEGGGVAEIGVEEPLEQATWFVGRDKQTDDELILILDSDCDPRVRSAPAR